MAEPKFSVSPAGQTARLQIEPMTLAHESRLSEPLLAPEVYTWCPPALDSKELHQYLAAIVAGPAQNFPDQIWWNHAITYRETGSGVGRLEATFLHAHVEIAYLLGPNWWGQGLASEALAWLISQIRRAAPEHGIWATVHPGNLPSQRLLQRHKFEKTADFPATLRSYDPGDDVFVWRGQ
jgi:[ribosomal protein S5]-alanine N-acetyltransferase